MENLTFKMEKREIYFIIGLIALILVCAFLFYIVLSEGKSCLKNPFVYGASKMEHVSCSCFQFNNPICPALFGFNDTTFTTQIRECEG